MKFKDLLRELRKRASLTQEQLAAKAGIPVTSLRGHEQGQRIPSWSSVVKLAKALGVSTDVFAGCDEVQEEQAESEPAKPRGRPRKADAAPVEGETPAEDKPAGAAPKKAAAKKGRKRKE